MPTILTRRYSWATSTSRPGRYDEAITAYREALDKSPNNPRLLYNLGSALMMKGDEFAAMEYFKKAGAADRIGEVAHTAYSRLGVMYIERKDFDEAEKYLKEAVSITAQRRAEPLQPRASPI